MKRHVLHITVAAAPRNWNMFENEVRLSKPALLYADKITLWSVIQTTMQELPNPVVGETVARDAYPDPDTFLFMDLREFIENDQNLESLADSSIDEVPTVHELRNLYQSSVVQFGSIQGLKTKGLVTLRSFIQHIIEDHQTIPLFDEGVNRWVRYGIERGDLTVTEPGAHRSSHMALASELISRLPVFETATVSEILDIRRELSGPLIRFRSAMLQFADSIRSEPWTSDFQIEADQVIRRDIEPIVLEIEEAVESNRELSILVQKASDKGWLVPPAITVAVTSAHSLPMIVAGAFSLAASGGALLYKSYREWLHGRQEIERNQLYFYYELGRRLER